MSRSQLQVTHGKALTRGFEKPESARESTSYHTSKRVMGYNGINSTIDAVRGKHDTFGSMVTGHWCSHGRSRGALSLRHFKSTGELQVTVTHGKALTRGFEMPESARESTSYHTSKRVMFTPNRVNGGINSIVSQSCSTGAEQEPKINVMGWIIHKILAELPENVPLRVTELRMR